MPTFIATIAIALAAIATVLARRPAKRRGEQSHPAFSRSSSFTLFSMPPP
jgi:hypothetical protein